MNKTPAVRFIGFAEDWEQREFSDIAETRRGLTYKPNSIVDNGVRVLRSSNINEDTFVFGNDDVFVDENVNDDDIDTLMQFILLLVNDIPVYPQA